MDRIFLRLGPNGALGADNLQWILYRASGRKNDPHQPMRAWTPVSFVHSTKAILERCIREKDIELSPEGMAALVALPATFDGWKTGALGAISDGLDGVDA